MDSPLPPPLSLLRPGGAPPPPPKNPARLMALALAEQAQQVAQRQSQQEHGSTPSAPRSPFYCSLSLKVGGEPLGTSGSGPPAPSLAHPDAWAPGPSPSLPRQQSVGSLVRSQRPLGISRRGHRSSAQVSAQLRKGGASGMCQRHCPSSYVLSPPGCFFRENPWLLLLSSPGVPATLSWGPKTRLVPPGLLILPAQFPNPSLEEPFGSPCTT